MPWGEGELFTKLSIRDRCLRPARFMLMYGTTRDELLAVCAQTRQAKGYELLKPLRTGISSRPAQQSHLGGQAQAGSRQDGQQDPVFMTHEALLQPESGKEWLLKC